VSKLTSPPPAARLRELGPDTVAVAEHTVVWRVHDTAGPHPRPWSALRHVGPVPNGRFDPHPPPPGPADEGVMYLALDVATALAERYQATRVVNRRRLAPHLVAFRPTRALHLLDLTGTWPLRAGASHAINTGRRDVAQAWARTIREAWPRLDGLWYTSSMTAEPCVALWAPAADAVPARPLLAQPLTHAGLLPWLAEACRQIGYTLL
jgi:hypothetical protein